MRYLLACIAIVGCAAPALGADHVVSQSGKAFSAAALKAKVGDTISFKNEDPFVHNIFSLSDVQSFDLGTFAKGELRQVKLGNAGKIEVECAVHPEMKLVVEVAK
ncbi:MAG TPA: plastocyanin/azurin family copper-binding protein [Steroidobacteraceae bacterium]|nr:plastocyanin/azurin family copper-binding protein [Steroidobacteraceae bacterium]